jgi:hypothetical protein
MYATSFGPFAGHHPACQYKNIIKEYKVLVISSFIRFKNNFVVFDGVSVIEIFTKLSFWPGVSMCNFEVYIRQYQRVDFPFLLTTFFIKKNKYNKVIQLDFELYFSSVRKCILPSARFLFFLLYINFIYISWL